MDVNNNNLFELLSYIDCGGSVSSGNQCYDSELWHLNQLSLSPGINFFFFFFLKCIYCTFCAAFHNPAMWGYMVITFSNWGKSQHGFMRTDTQDLSLWWKSCWKTALISPPPYERCTFSVLLALQITSEPHFSPLVRLHFLLTQTLSVILEGNPVLIFPWKILCNTDLVLLLDTHASQSPFIFDNKYFSYPFSFQNLGSEADAETNVLLVSAEMASPGEPLSCPEH